MARLLSAFRPRTEIFQPRRLVTAALNVLLPPTCVLCVTPVDAPGLLCGDCFGGLDLLGEPCCVCCGAPFEFPWHAAEGGLCQRCLDTPPAFERARAAMNYDAASRRLILPFKHGDRTEFARLLARLMAGAGGRLLSGCDVLVPVPLHRRRLFTRRYNQSALLARVLGRMSGRPVVVDALRRNAATETLGGKSAAERRDEVAGAFTVRQRREARISGRRVLLIDDVMTSGATANECAKCLLEAGAAAVDVLVAVRVPDPRQYGTARRRFRRRRLKPSRSLAAQLGRRGQGDKGPATTPADEVA
jgi:ComF family protein